jgi:hypothetical protein
MAGVCLTCCLKGEVEDHHVAGRRNHPLTVPVCADCHRILSNWQRAAGVELRGSVAGTLLDSRRALLVGAMHLLQLFAQRHAGTAWFPDWLAARAGRAISKLLDMAQPTDRPGRWLPDPTVLPVVAAPAPCPAASEVEWVGEMARLAQALTEIIGGIPPLAAAAVSAIAKDPAGWTAQVDDAAQDQTYAEALLGLVSQYIDIANVLMAKLFQLDDLDHFDDELRSATAGFRDTVRDLFNQLRRVLPEDLEGAS